MIYVSYISYISYINYVSYVSYITYICYINYVSCAFKKRNSHQKIFFKQEKKFIILLQKN